MDNIKAIAWTVKRATRDLSVIALCEFIIALPETKLRHSSDGCPKCEERRRRNAANVAKFRGKRKEP